MALAVPLRPTSLPPQKSPRQSPRKSPRKSPDSGSSDKEDTKFLRQLLSQARGMASKVDDDDYMMLHTEPPELTEVREGREGEKGEGRQGRDKERQREGEPAEGESEGERRMGNGLCAFRQDRENRLLDGQRIPGLHLGESVSR